MKGVGNVVRGCGVDLIEIDRVARALRRKAFKQKLFTARERQLVEGRPAGSWAARFAAKEAAMKALGCGWQKGVGFCQIEILQDEWGKPYIVLCGRAREIAEDQGISQLFVSLSHSRDTAIAYVVAVGEE